MLINEKTVIGNLILVKHYQGVRGGNGFETHFHHNKD